MLNKHELELAAPQIAEKIRKGGVFLHPSDTIYGLGCNAKDEKAVKKVRELKGQSDKPFSVWAPSVDWIRENCVVDKKAEEWLGKLPGPYTLILKMKNKSCVAKSVHLDKNTLGVRIPSHWMQDFVSAVNTPIITTSANRTGEPFMTSHENLHPDIKRGLDFIIYEGEKRGRPSQIVDLTGAKTIVKNR